ncbi:MAG TPA: DegT/DnrJ/EryC1/StrS family aminotransferase [Bacteroidia bacterium]|nr:DegT/DnrJ/EryC1/StrS family aminotransferase [Bacteroidia bacterium]
MNYFFPSFIECFDVEQKSLPQLKITVNSGTNALRLLLRSFDLSPNDKIAIPAFVCDSVKYAVEQEKLTPVLFDLKPDNSFWTSYDIDLIKSTGIKAVILVHLYGFIHPDTKEIVDFCESNNIKLIHDAAQSYGIDEEKLNKGDGIVYSFGPGKSTTAAGGAWIKTVEGKESFFTLSKPTLFSFQNARAKLFLKTRIFGYKLNKYEKLLNKIVNKTHSTTIFSMSSFQLKMASYSVSKLSEITPFRKKRYFMLKEAIIKNPLLTIINSDTDGLNFKIILFIKNEINKFKKYLELNNIPYFTLFDKIQESDKLINFKKNARKFVEISCEASIPESEIERIASLINNFK